LPTLLPLCSHARCLCALSLSCHHAFSTDDPPHSHSLLNRAPLATHFPPTNQRTAQHSYFSSSTLKYVAPPGAAACFRAHRCAQWTHGKSRHHLCRLPSHNVSVLAVLFFLQATCSPNNSDPTVLPMVCIGYWPCANLVLNVLKSEFDRQARRLKG
jgi:hypothetical protein